MSERPPPTALLTDLYQLTMACAYWKSGTHTKEAVFHLFFRKHPFQSGFSINCGLEDVIRYLQNFEFSQSDLNYLAGLTGADGRPLFEPGFLEYLKSLRLSVQIDGIPEGTVVFPNEPLLRIQGPIIEGQILETALLNIVNFQTLIATKAARIGSATRGDPVLEFGLRRAQGVDGALAASRAAYIGGCAATSNVLAGKLFGIPVRGTHAHSWVMSFDDELEAFKAYALALPNNCTFLVDTYDTLAGVRKAVEVGRWLRSQGHEMIGVRLDSGDLAYLSMEARKILDAAGFGSTQIVASNDLDEQTIVSLREQGAAIHVWGVGTRLVTGYDQPALGGVYKLTAVRAPGRAWQYKVKLSEQAIKVSNPGIQQVRRFQKDNEYIGDMIYDVEIGVSDSQTMIDPLDPTRQKRIPKEAAGRDLLVPILRDGKTVYSLPPLRQIRDLAQRELAGFHPGIKRFLNPHEYPVGLESRLMQLRTKLILNARGRKS
ncbi:MAG: nicotinate phosphoribosyltransferase [Verrucomicrobia bacterium]|nr:nicotinate phosphoribosyltransferase [Verrucomicrobiota bacterium]